jgi:signal transduction histidine kinase
MHRRRFATTYFFLPPGRSVAVHPHDVPGLLLFVTVALLVALLHEAVRQAQRNRERVLAREQAAHAQAEAANRAKDVFLAMVSHELRTPLTAILGWARLLQSRRLEEPAFAAALESIERNAKLQLKIIEDLLDISRIISGKITLHLRPIELAPVIQASCDAVRPSAEAKGIDLKVALDPAGGLVAADPERMQQVVSNLLSNAVKFTPEGGVVEVRLEQADAGIQVTVSDTGPGIPAAFLPHIFERFSQADTAARAHGGLGLGLAIARQLTELHGGTIQAQNRNPGSGATFTVRLPAAGARHGPEPDAPSPAQS